MHLELSVALQRVAPRFIASPGPQMGPQTTPQAMPSARNYLIEVLILVVFGMGASSSQSRCATRLRHAPSRSGSIRAAAS